MLEVYRKYESHTKIVSYHAGLEAWVIAKKLWLWAQAVSIWPTILNAHTVNEKCKLDTVESITEVLVDFLKKI